MLHFYRARCKLIAKLKHNFGTNKLYYASNTCCPIWAIIKASNTGVITKGLPLSNSARKYGANNAIQQLLEDMNMITVVMANKAYKVTFEI